MKFVAVLFVLCALIVAETTSKYARELFECQLGEAYVENECNNCYCVQGNELVCAIKSCPHNKEKGLEKCESGSVWMKGCNKCWCVNLGTVCTNYKCS